MNQIVLIRADASSRIGTGHIMRCLVLAEELRENDYKVTFLTKPLEGNLNQKIIDNGFPVISIESSAAVMEIKEVSALIKEKNASLIVFDHYNIDHLYERQVKEDTGVKILSLDDTYEKHRCDILLNQNIYADAKKYLGLVPEHCKLLCGLEYALIRKEFKSIQKRARLDIDPENVNILVTMGGADPDNVTIRVMRSLDAMEDANPVVTVVLGAANPRIEEIRLFADTAKHAFNVIVNTSNMAELMNWADFAVTAGGATTIELMYMQVPSFIIVLAPNQRLIAKSMQKRGAGFSLGDSDAFDSAVLQEKITAFLHAETSRNAVGKALRKLLIGNGEKVLKAVLCTLYASYRIRHATAEDMVPVFELSNDKEVRKYALHPEQTTWAEHTRWFNHRIQTPNSPFLIIEYGTKLLGQIRFDKKEEGYIYSISLSKEIRGCGFASDIIQKSLRFLPAKSKIIACIKRGNIPSIKSFKKSGFANEYNKENGTSVLRLTRITE